MDAVELRVDPFPADAELAPLWAAAWEHRGAFAYRHVLERSLCHVGAYAGEQLVGFVNVAWDGGVHAFLLDTTVHPDFQRRGIATQLVGVATEDARQPWRALAACRLSSRTSRASTATAASARRWPA